MPDSFSLRPTVKPIVKDNNDIPDYQICLVKDITSVVTLKTEGCPIKTICNIDTESWFYAEYVIIHMSDDKQLHSLNKIFTNSMVSDINHLYSCSLDRESFVSVLEELVKYINLSIKTRDGLNRLFTQFSCSNFDVIYDHIKNTCEADFYCLFRPTRLNKLVGSIFDDITKEEHEELSKVMTLYSVVFGSIFTVMLAPMAQNGLNRYQKLVEEETSNTTFKL